jgi:hypothetical protein
MIRIKQRILAALVALALAASGTAYVPQVADDPSQWGVAKKGSFDLTKVEQLAGGKDPEIPVVTGLAGGRDPEIPVVTG